MNDALCVMLCCLSSPVFSKGGFAAWRRDPRNSGPPMVADIDLSSFVSGARWWTPEEWITREVDESHGVPDDPEARIVAEDVIPFVFPVKVIERVVLFALGACGVSLAPSWCCDDPLLGRVEWQDFALLNGEYLTVSKDFANNLCVAFMNVNQELFGVLGIRAAVFLDDFSFESTSILANLSSNATLFACELILTCKEKGKEEPHVILSGQLKSSEDPMALAVLVVAELAWGTKSSLASFVSVQRATEMFRKAVEVAAPRGVLYAAVVLGGVLASSGKVRESISLFESAFEFLKTEESPDTEVCKGLLYEAYFRLMEVHFPAGPSRFPILGSIAAAGVSRDPRSRVLLEGMRFCTDLEPLLTRMVATDPTTEMFLVASSLLQEPGAVQILEKALLHNRNCVAIWLQYLKLVKVQQEQVLFRALRSSPWNKKFWILLFESCSTDNERRDVYQLMVAKQIRLRHVLK